MKYDRREIMRAAHRKCRHFDLTFSQALHLAWVEAKLAASRYNVYGENIASDSRHLLASGVDWDEAGRTEWYNKYCYDRISIEAI